MFANQLSKPREFILIFSKYYLQPREFLTGLKPWSFQKVAFTRHDSVAPYNILLCQLNKVLKRRRGKTNSFAAVLRGNWFKVCRKHCSVYQWNCLFLTIQKGSVILLQNHFMVCPVGFLSVCHLENETLRHAIDSLKNPKVNKLNRQESFILRWNMLFLRRV